MKKKFKRKEIFYVLLLTLAVITPFIPRYHRLDLQLKFKYVIIPGICLIFALLAIIGLIDTVREEDKEEDKESNGTNISEDDFNNCYENVSIDNKIALMQRLRELKNEKFEEFVKTLFKMKSYKIEYKSIYYKGKPLADGGKDLIVQKNNKIENVQIKKYYRQPITKNTIATFKGLIGNEPGYFITTSVFYDDAKNFAEENGITCVDYNKLNCVISKLSKVDKQYLENFINNPKNIEITAHPKTCKECGAPMVKRNGGYGCLRYYCYDKERCKCREFYK